ncbi:MAG TPA: undecaprenyl-diphosphate phosphatase [Firmicutes bacterium]|nr:undecaprenyl-diphosphate phosphatase [Bacillota bacterium]
MSIVKALVLGIIQGLTEFLPVSSSGHLVLARGILHTQEALLTFDTMVHVGTLLAVVAVFWNDIIEVFRAAIGIVAPGSPGYGGYGNGGHGTRGRDRKDSAVDTGGRGAEVNRRLFWLIVVGTIPAGVMGITLEDVFKRLFESPASVAVFLILTGVLLWLAEKLKTEDIPIARFSLLRGFLVGVAQGCAIAPGLSRSGSTISTGLLLGLPRDEAARYSFLLSIPVILGAAVLQLKEVFSAGLGGLALPLIIGVMASAISGYLAIRLLLAVVRRGRLTVFSYYCWAVGLIVLARHFFLTWF